MKPEAPACNARGEACATGAEASPT
jgi:hypothetical protein